MGYIWPANFETQIFSRFWSVNIDKTIQGWFVHRLLFENTFSFWGIERGQAYSKQVGCLKCLEWGGKDQDHYLLRLSAVLLELQHLQRKSQGWSLFVKWAYKGCPKIQLCSSEMACTYHNCPLFAWSSRFCGQKLCWSLLVLELVCDNPVILFYVS